MTNQRLRGDRGVIATAAVSLAVTTAMVGFFLSGVTSDEVSRSEYRDGLSARLQLDSRLTAPVLSDEATALYVTCLADGTYSSVTDKARTIIARGDFSTLHKNDLGKLVERAKVCRDSI
ncbi:hypothetical protein [Flaviflexus equikiangi]|uniref:hypothetical protein n=1 Tax=Flaviflexus equikiangi TaxID=2758573 RepID=UPI0015F4F871|nr:hypothetical protein [Flaviflexus equikiangi]